MDSEANKAVVQRYIEMWNTRDTALADEVLAADYVDHAHPEVAGTESVKNRCWTCAAHSPIFTSRLKPS